MKSRARHHQDLQAIAVTLAGAFAHDPVWGWAFSDRDQLEVWWRFWVQRGAPAGWVRLTAHAEAVAVWIPPGGSELPPEDEATRRAAARALIGERAALVLEGARLASRRNHPGRPAYYYLTLFGTAPEHRGHGIGMELLAETLATHRRRARGRVPRVEQPGEHPALRVRRVRAARRFELPEDHGTVTTMWRDPR